MLPISYGPLTFQGGGAAGGLKYKGSVAFEELPTAGQQEGDMYNITNDFVLGGKHYVAGTNVAWTGSEWDALGGGTAVQSVNSKTGAVVLNAGDINATNMQSVQANLERIDERIDNTQGMVIEANNNTTVNGHQVPELTSEQIVQAYNGLVAGKSVVITDANGDMHFAVDQADTISDEIYVTFNYFDIMILDYNEDGTITFKETTSKTYVDTAIANAIGTAMEGEY